MSSSAPTSPLPATEPQNKYQYQSHRSHCIECRGPAGRPPTELGDHMYWSNVWHIKSGSRELMHEVKLTRPVNEGPLSPGEVDRCSCELGQHTKRGERVDCHHVKWARFRRGQHLEALGLAYGMGDLFEGEEKEANP